MAQPDFDPSDAVDFWDLTNRQDWAVCELQQRGTASAAYTPGRYSLMEDMVHAFDVMLADGYAAGRRDDPIRAAPRQVAREGDRGPGLGDLAAGTVSRTMTCGSSDVLVDRDGHRPCRRLVGLHFRQREPPHRA